MQIIAGIIASAYRIAGNFESIATVTVGSGGSSSITFSSIPSTYKHLQVRVLAKIAYSTSDYESLDFRFNSDTTSSYSYHRLTGDGSSASAAGSASTSYAYAGYGALGNSGSTTFGSSIIDILDYASTSKYKTIKSLGGADFNGSGAVALFSASWQKTDAITSITFTDANGNYAEYSSFALYGIKGA